MLKASHIDAYLRRRIKHMGAILDSLVNLWNDTGIANFNYQNGIMILVSFVFLYLAINKGFEPLLLVPIAFGMLLSNLPISGMFIEHFEITSSDQLTDAGILTIFYVLKPILPSLIFLGVGAMTDFGPLIANPKSLLMGEMCIRDRLWTTYCPRPLQYAVRLHGEAWA